MEQKIEFEDNRYDIEISETKYVKKDKDSLKSHFLNLKFSGKDINVKILNMLRRVCSNYIPVFAYAKEKINVIENTSVAFNNDMMRLDLSLLPIYDIDPEIYELNEEYWYDVNYADTDRQKHQKEVDKNIELYVAYHNNSSEIVDVTTKDCQVNLNGNKIDMYSEKYPILLIQLKANQTFKCHMKGVLGIGERREDGALWKSAKRAYYNELDEKQKYEFIVYGNEQFTEYELLIRTCKFIISKLNKIKNMFKNKVDAGEIAKERNMKFVLENEDHTFGEPINFELQDDDNIVFSGFAKPDQTQKTGVITVSCKKSIESPIKEFQHSIETVIDKVHKIGYLLTKLNKSDTKKNLDSDKNEDLKEKIKGKKTITTKNNNKKK